MSLIKMHPATNETNETNETSETNSKQHSKKATHRAPPSTPLSRVGLYETNWEAESSRRGGSGWDEGRGRLRRPWWQM
jgi:hypothetical protein